MPPKQTKAPPLPRAADESTALRDDSPPTVAAYFELVLSRPLADPQRRDPPHVANPSHPSFHIETGCGVECKAAIDACAAFVEHVRAAFGEETIEEEEIITNCTAVVLCYVYG